MEATQSIWNSFAVIEKYPALTKDITTDVAIVLS